MTPAPKILVTLDDVYEAAERIAPHITRTPLIGAGGPLALKAEHLQTTRSFKLRGVVNAVARLTAAADGRQLRLVAQSSGNHGRALACAARRFGHQATVVLADTAAPHKVARIRELGAETVLVPARRRGPATADLARERGATVVSSDDLDVIAGHGTIALEILADLPETGLLLAPVCNGGLLSGLAVVAKALRPDVRVVGVEPELAADARASLRAGHRVTWPVERTYRTVADGLRAPVVGAHAWEHIRRCVDDIVTVTEAQITEAMARLTEQYGITAEPSGAVATAAHLAGAVPPGPGGTVAILSGGSVPPGTPHAPATKRHGHNEGEAHVDTSTPVDIDEPMRITDERVVATFDAGPPDIGALWELCVHLEWDRKAAVDGIAAWLGDPEGLRVLDAACGSGFPAIDLAARGYDMTCSDGSPRMLEYFHANAAALGVDVEAVQEYWEKVGDRFAGAFDVVMCRGSALPYAGSWDADAEPDREALRRSVEGFAACLKPGGRLYIDTTLEQNLKDTAPHRTTYPGMVIGEHAVDLTEVVTTDLDARTRRWDSVLTVDGVEYRFVRRSHYLSHEDLTQLMHDAGVSDIARQDVAGETYAVFSGTLRP